MQLRRTVVLLTVGATLTGLTLGCGDDSADRPEVAADPSAPGATASTEATTTTTMSTEPPASPPSSADTTSAPSTAPPPPMSLDAAPATTPAPAVTPAPAPPADAPQYAATVAVIDEATKARMTYSWRPGCPVALEDLRLLTLRHWDNDGNVVNGELVVHADHADAMVAAFGRLFDLRFPIQRMELVDVFQGDDQASMRANNTSGFNCREVDGRPGVWSQHSYGGAIDVNPLVNPWVRGSQVDPPEGAPYADRSTHVPGGIYAGDAVVRAFASVGWKWGGYWSGSKDYQHFSANGQ